MSEQETPKGDEVDVKALQEALQKQTEINEGFKKQLDGISGQLRLAKKEEVKEEPKKEETPVKEGDDPTKALESKINQMEETFNKRSFELDRKEIFIENGITSDDDKAMFDGITDLEAVKRIAIKIKAMAEANPKKPEEELKKTLSIDTLLPKGKEKMDASDLFAAWKAKQS